MSTPNFLLQGIPNNFLTLKYVDEFGPIIVAIEKTTITYDPPSTMPANPAKWEMVADSIGLSLKPRMPDLLRDYGDDRSTESGVRWRHVDLTAERLAEKGINLRTMAHDMMHRSSWGGGHV